MAFDASPEKSSIALAPFVHTHGSPELDAAINSIPLEEDKLPAAMTAEEQLKLIDRLAEYWPGNGPSGIEVVRVAFRFMPVSHDGLRRFACPTIKAMLPKCTAVANTEDGLRRILKRLDADGWLIRFKKDYCLWPSGLDQTRQLITFVWPNYRKAFGQAGLQLQFRPNETRPGEPEKYPIADRVSDPKYPTGDRVFRTTGVGGRGGSARSERQLRLDELAEWRYMELTQHVSGVGDDVAEQVRRTEANLRQAIEDGFSSLRDELVSSLNFSESHLRHGHGHGADGAQRRKENEKLRRLNFHRAITAADLQEDWTVEELFGVTVGQLPETWKNTEHDRIDFFALAFIALAKDNPGGWFHDAILGNWRSFITIIATDNARAAVKRVLHSDFPNEGQSSGEI